MARMRAMAMGWAVVALVLGMATGAGPAQADEVVRGFGFVTAVDRERGELHLDRGPRLVVTERTRIATAAGKALAFEDVVAGLGSGRDGLVADEDGAVAYEGRRTRDGSVAAAWIEVGVQIPQ